MTDNSNIPKIDPVPHGTYRPFWSVMIPTYNCANYLRETLESVLAQDPGHNQMQIEVVDDCSTKDDPESVVKEIGKGRVDFYRQPKNVGPTMNFNTCLQRSRGQWVHILHGDDFVLDGAYKEFTACINAYPTCEAIFARCIFVDAGGRWKSITPVLGSEDRGILRYDPLQWSSNPVQFAGIVLSRDSVAQIGGFDEAFQHVADWNLWWRLALTGKVLYSNTCVGAYRIFEGNHTSQLRLSGLNILESAQQIRLITATNGIGVRRATLYQRLYSSALKQCLALVNDKRGFESNVKALLEFPPEVRNSKDIAKLRLIRLKRQLSSLLSSPS